MSQSRPGGDEQVAQPHAQQHDGVDDPNVLFLHVDLGGQVGFGEGVGCSEGVDAGVGQEGENEYLSLLARTSLGIHCKLIF